MIVGFAFAGSAVAGRASAAPPGTPLPIPVNQVDSFLTVHPDNTVTLYHSIIEHGQGTHTGMLQVVAEELDVNLSQMKQALLDTATAPQVGTSSASAGLL